MKIVLNIVTIVFAVLASHISFTQCPSPSQLMKPDRKSGWSESSQSKSGALMSGQEYTYTFIAQRGMEYKVNAFAGVDVISSENVDFKLYYTEVEKTMIDGEWVYDRVDKVVFDSKSNKEDKGEITFSSSKTRKLTMKLSLTSFEKENVVQCVAICVETRRMPDIGLK